MIIFICDIDRIGELDLCYMLYILVVVGAFTLPKVYEVNKAQIDRYVDMAQSRFDDYYKQYVHYDSIHIVL